MARESKSAHIGRTEVNTSVADVQVGLHNRIPGVWIIQISTNHCEVHLHGTSEELDYLREELELAFLDLRRLTRDSDS